MGTVTAVKLEGFQELADAFEQLKEQFTVSKATGNNIAKRALVKAGQPIAANAQAKAHRRTGKLQGSFGVSTKLSRRQKQQNNKQSQVEVYAGPASLVQAITEEFGTSHNAPNPMLRPAWDSGKAQALKDIRDNYADELEKARKRLARKAERLLNSK